MKTLLHAAALLAGAPALALLSGSAAAQLSVDHQVGFPGFNPAAYRGADGFGGGAMGGAKLWRASQSPGGEAALYEKRQEASVTSNVNKEYPATGERLHVLQDDRVNHQGQPIALVIAETLEQANHAATAISFCFRCPRGPAGAR
jgi:hypothetical protein